MTEDNFYVTNIGIDGWPYKERKPASIIKPKLTEGYKADEDKLRYDLIPPEIMEALASILTFGAKKYEDRNWEKGMSWHRPFGALMRHMWAWWNPLESDTDPETGKSHLWHAACCLAFLIAYEARKVGNDNRPRL